MWWITKMLWWRRHDPDRFLDAPLRARLLALSISDATHGADPLL